LLAPDVNLIFCACFIVLSVFRGLIRPTSYF